MTETKCKAVRGFIHRDGHIKLSLFQPKYHGDYAAAAVSTIRNTESDIEVIILLELSDKDIDSMILDVLHKYESDNHDSVPQKELRAIIRKHLFGGEG